MGKGAWRRLTGHSGRCRFAARPDPGIGSRCGRRSFCASFRRASSRWDACRGSIAAACGVRRQPLPDSRVGLVSDPGERGGENTSAANRDRRRRRARQFGGARHGRLRRRRSRSPVHRSHSRSSDAPVSPRRVVGGRTLREQSMGAAISLADAVALVERVRESAARGARETFAALAAAVPVPVAGVAIRVCPRLPPTTGERIADVRHDQCALRGLTIRPGGRAGNSARRPTRASMASATARRAPNWRRLRHRVNRRRACCSSHTSRRRTRVRRAQAPGRSHRRDEAAACARAFAASGWPGVPLPRECLPLATPVAANSDRTRCPA